MSFRRSWFLTAIACVLAIGRLAAADPKASVFDQANALWKSGQYTNAVAAITAGLKANPKDDRLLNQRAQMNSILGNYEEAVSDFTAALEIEPKSSFLFRERAVARFKLGRFEDSASDFDQVNQLLPKAAPHNWQRGIALYYAGRFKDGREQFELHQTVNSGDVENAVWHFLCTAREQSFDAARKKIFPYREDDRIPMKEIHALFAGTLKPEDVLAAATKGTPKPAELRYQTFYAHLYLGLFFEAQGNADRAREELVAAVPLADPADYMGTVAKVHALRLVGRLPSTKK
jgi:lipoprotein NlpI